MDVFRFAERLMSMDDEAWARHANPWSAWTRFSCGPFIVLAIWSRVWLGWWALLPLALALEIDLVHFGVVMVLNIQLGMLTPPFGLNLFVSSGITGRSIEKIARGVLPFLAIMLVCLMLVTYIPAISLWLPELLLGR